MKKAESRSQGVGGLAEVRQDRSLTVAAQKRVDYFTALMEPRA